jgi:Mn-dependent DtxR family transcriptional regulator
MTHSIILETLDSLLVLHGLNVRVDAGALARRLGVRPTEVAHALVHLERRGLADAATARLTLAGLAAATALAAHRVSSEISRAA